MPSSVAAPRPIWLRCAAIVVCALLAGCGKVEYHWRPLRAIDPPKTAFPVAVSSNQRYLVDRQGVPVLLHGDAAWSLISGLTDEDAERYLDDRKQHGFNTILVNLIEHKFNGPVDRAGDGPFTTPGDFTVPNERYFEHADWLLKKAAEKGILVLLAPCYLGYKDSDEGWYEEVLANGVEEAAAYGRFVAERYKNLENVVWVLAGDRNPGLAMPHVRAMASAIAEVDKQHLLTAHMAPETSTRDIFPNDDWVDLNLTYSYGLVHAMVMRDYYRTPVMPTVLVESTYEGEHGSTPQWIRRQAYGALLNGAAGEVMGNRPIWLFDEGWRDALQSPGNLSMVHLEQLFLLLPWSELAPDFSLVSDGYGNPRGQDFVSAARSSDGSVAVIYLPTSRTVTVDLSTIHGDRAQAWWFDPRLGQVASIGTYPTGQQIQLEPPGSDDWVVVIHSESRKIFASE